MKSVNEDKMPTPPATAPLNFSNLEQFLLSLSKTAREMERGGEGGGRAPSSSTPSPPLPLDLFNLKQTIKSQPIDTLRKGIEARKLEKNHILGL